MFKWRVEKIEWKGWLGVTSQDQEVGFHASYSLQRRFWLNNNRK